MWETLTSVDMYTLFDNMGLQHLTWQAVILRFLLAILFGGVVGLERTRKRRAAGFRTHILVCLGATGIMMTGQFVFENIGGTDPARLGAQVISGIGFLGAGTILVTGSNQIKGLTTAASLWTSACMGIAIGIGFYFGAFILCITIFAVMTLFNEVQNRYVARTNAIRLYVVFESIKDMSCFLELCREKSIHIGDFETTRSQLGTGIAVLFTLHFQERKSHQEVIKMISDCSGIIAIEEI